MALTKEQILGLSDIKSELVDVPEWGEGAQVRVGMMSGTARDAWEASLLSEDGRPSLANMRANLCAATIVDESGKPIFCASDVVALGAKNWQALDRIARAAQRLNKLEKSDLEEAKGN